MDDKQFKENIKMLPPIFKKILRDYFTNNLIQLEKDEEKKKILMEKEEQLKKEIKEEREELIKLKMEKEEQIEIFYKVLEKRKLTAEELKQMHDIFH